jgi:hypothetical protein
VVLLCLALVVPELRRRILVHRCFLDQRWSDCQPSPWCLHPRLCSVGLCRRWCSCKSDSLATRVVTDKHSESGRRLSHWLPGILPSDLRNVRLQDHGRFQRMYRHHLVRGANVSIVASMFYLHSDTVSDSMALSFYRSALAPCSGIAGSTCPTRYRLLRTPRPSS